MIHAWQKVALEHDFLDATEKVVQQGTKFSSMYVPFLWLLCHNAKFILQTLVSSIQLEPFQFGK